MAGIHQLWTFDPMTGRRQRRGGHHQRGAGRRAARARRGSPSHPGSRARRRSAVVRGLRDLRRCATSTDGAVAHGRRHRALRLRPPDGPADEALLQHPLGVTALPDGSVPCRDTYNGAVRRYDPATAELSTLAVHLAEPSAAVVSGDHLVVVESGAHRLSWVPLGSLATPDGFSHTTQRPVTEVAAGDLELVVAFEPPVGQKVDDRLGPPSQLMVTATPPQLLAAGEGQGSELSRTLRIDPSVGDGVLHIAARAASCDVDAGEGAACHMHQQDWGVPVRIVDGGMSRLVLPLSGAGHQL